MASEDIETSRMDETSRCHRYGVEGGREGVIPALQRMLVANAVSSGIV